MASLVAETCAQFKGRFLETARPLARHGHCNTTKVNKRIAILHANCQGRPLAAQLLASPEFAEAFTPRVYLNYAREEIPAAELERCGLFLYQHLGPEWGELSSDALLARLPAGCPSLCIPNMFFRGPWPLWSGAPGFDYRDSLLDHLLDMNLPRRDILHLYLSTQLSRKVDLDALLAETLARETERQARTPVQYLDFVLAHWRKRPLFFSVNHPGPELLRLAATGILRHLGLAAPKHPTQTEPQQTELRQTDLPPAPAPLGDCLGEGYGDFELPVHPQVAAFYGLEYGDAQTVYNVYGRGKTFAQYAAAYVDCRQMGLDDFIGYLHLA